MPSPLKPKHQVQKYTKIEPKMTVKFDEIETKPQNLAIHVLENCVVVPKCCITKVGSQPRIRDPPCSPFRLPIQSKNPLHFST